MTHCPCCGAPVDIRRRTCPYCDVPYEIDRSDTVYLYVDNKPIYEIANDKLKAEINYSIAKQIQEINNGYRKLYSQFTSN